MEYFAGYLSVVVVHMEGVHLQVAASYFFIASAANSPISSS
jgi:hypothetical protein